MAALRRMSLVTIMVLFVDIATAANDATFSESSILTVDDLKLLRDWGLVSGYSSSACCMSTKGCNDPATFHANCDNASRTVVMAELANGKRIGGYTGKASWELEGYCKTAPESFLFSLNNKYRHTLRNNEESSFCPYPTQGPRFGFKHEFFVDDGFDRMNCHNLGDVYKCRNGTVTSACEDDFCGGQFKVGSSYWVSISKLEVFVLQATCEAFKCPAGFARTHTAAASPSTAVCCQPECAVPSSTQGYDLEYAGGVLTISGFAPQNVYCAKGYAGDVTYTPCSSAGTPYTVSGCLPVCTVPSSPGYNFSSTGGVRTISGFNPTGVTCADGYTGTVSYEVCPSAGTPYTVSGCVAECTVPAAEAYLDYDFSAAGGVRTISGFNPTGVSCADDYTGNVSYEVCSSAGTPYKVSGCAVSASSQDMPSLFLMLVLALLCINLHASSASTRM